MRIFPSNRMIRLLACLALVVVAGGNVFAQPDASVDTQVTSDAAQQPFGQAIDDVQPSGDDEQELAEFYQDSSLCHCESDRVFLLSTRHLPSDPCRAPLNQIPFRMWRLDSGTSCSIDPLEHLATLTPGRPVVFYIHGNRMPAGQLLTRSMKIRQKIRCNSKRFPIDWIIFSWPSDQEMIGVRDFRLKADRCDAQGLYLASFIRAYAEASIPMAFIGYSFGARVATGALHALAGGRLSGRKITESPFMGANVRVGLVAPAIESKWLCGNGYHCMATKNMDELVLLYNRRDVVLKRYWLLEKIRRDTALGYSGPSCFAPRLDGTKLPVQSRDCSPIVKLRHSELDYYQGGCNAGRDMARLINGIGHYHF